MEGDRMAKRPKSKRKAMKVGRPAEHLLITEHPQVALDKKPAR
jgi:hypothetical protein